MIDSSSKEFIHYKSGIFGGTEECGTTNLNHAVSIVGYSYSGNYWIVKNSWGHIWGEVGYMRLNIIDGKGNCGINTEVSYPNIHFMTITNSAVCFGVALAAALISLWPLYKLKCCKREDLLFLHDG